MNTLRTMSKSLLVVQLLFLYGVRCEPCRRRESVNITFGQRFENGSIVYDGFEYTEGSWYEAEEGNQTITLGCPCIGRNCLWKCCGSQQVFVDKECVDSDLEDVNPFSPQIFKNTESLDIKAHEHFHYMYSNKLCDSRYLVDSQWGDGIYIQQNGSMMENVEGRVMWHKPAYFCVDMMVSGNTSRLVACPCHPTGEPIPDDSKMLYVMYGVGLLLSVPFLLVTFLVYAFIQELRNLHGMCLMAYCAGLVVAFPLLAYLKMQGGTVSLGMTGCIVVACLCYLGYFCLSYFCFGMLGIAMNRRSSVYHFHIVENAVNRRGLAFIVYYAFQTSFFWLNVMCIDIWRTFRGYRGGSSKKRHEQRRFAMYGLYAWGVPLLLASLTAFMQFGSVPNYIIKPGLGDMRCWFPDWKRDLLYFYSPVLVLVLCNTVLFSVTAYRIRSIKQETAILKSSESARSDRLKKDKQRYGLYLKLFMVMGVNWTVELIGFAVGGSNWYWLVGDLSNIMLGFFIFLIFVWKKKVRNLVRKSWNNFCGTRSVADGLGNWATRTSSAPTEDTRVSADDTAMKMKELH